MRMNRSPTPPPEVAEVLERWRPAKWPARDVDALEPLLPTVRKWVTAVPPHDANQAQRFLGAVAGIAVWAHRSLGTVDRDIVLTPENVEYWSMRQNPHLSPKGREKLRWLLRIIGRAANPTAWPPPPQKVSRLKVAEPYTPAEETDFVAAARLPGRSNRATRMWVVSGALGAGLNGVEITAARTADLEDFGNGRLVVRVRGNNSRLVPIRAAYTNLARAAASLCPTDRFVTGDHHNAVHAVAQGLGPVNAQGLSLRRARSTWLSAHLTAGTPLASLRRVAGPLSANTLDSLLGYINASLDDMTAVTGALGA